VFGGAVVIARWRNGSAGSCPGGAGAPTRRILVATVFAAITAIVDPLTGAERPAVGPRVGYAAVIATGSLPRVLLGQWDIPQEREDVRTVER